MGCVPPACWPYPSVSLGGGGVSQHALGGGVYPSMHRAGGCLIRGSVSARGDLADTPWTRGRHSPCEQSDRQVEKHYLAATLLRAVKMEKKYWRSQRFFQPGKVGSMVLTLTFRSSLLDTGICRSWVRLHNPLHSDRYDSRSRLGSHCSSYRSNRLDTRTYEEETEKWV